MKMIASKRLRTVLIATGIIAGLFSIGRLLMTTTSAKASSPNAIQQHQQKVTTSCLKISGLRDPKPVGKIIIFGDEVGYDALLIRGHYPQPHMNNKSGQFLCLFNRKTRQAYASEAKQSNIYNSNASDFQFEYPVGYAVESRLPDRTSERFIEWIDVWTQRDYDGIKSGKSYAELPPNVSVAVQPNPRKLALQTWVLQNNQFASPKNFNSLTVANQRAISFQSTGLYEYEYVVISHPNSSKVIVIKFDKLGIPESDGMYRPVFQQIISSLQFISK